MANAARKLKARSSLTEQKLSNASINIIAPTKAPAKECPAQTITESTTEVEGKKLPDETALTMLAFVLKTTTLSRKDGRVLTKRDDTIVSNKSNDIFLHLSWHSCEIPTAQSIDLLGETGDIYSTMQVHWKCRENVEIPQMIATV